MKIEFFLYIFGNPTLNEFMIDKTRISHKYITDEDGEIRFYYKLNFPFTKNCQLPRISRVRKYTFFT